MKKMLKVLSVICAASIMLFAFAGCGSNSAASGSTASTGTASTAPSTDAAASTQVSAENAPTIV